MKTNKKNLFLLFTVIAFSTHYASSNEEPINEVSLGLEVTTYAPGSDPAQFKTPTHLAFGPGRQEIVTDLKNNRFIFRDSPEDPFQISPVPVSGQHSVVYNPADGLYYANDTENHRIIAFADLRSGTLAAQTKNIAGIPLKRPHDIVLDPATGWIYAINPNSGHVFRFTAIGENERAIAVPVQGYARALTFTNGKLYAIGSAKGRIVEVVDWEKPTFKIYDSFDPTGRSGPAGSWTTTGLVLNDAEFFDGFWYASSFFTKSYAGETDFDENKFIRFKTLDDLVKGKWTDLSSLIPSGMVPYYLTVQGDKLYLAIFNQGSRGSGDSILQFTPLKTPSSPEKNNQPNTPIAIRVASYNVEFGRSATPEQIGEMFKPYKLDIIGFDEAPDGDWTARVGKVLGMPYRFVGKISSANHKNKYKTILSRTPLEGTEEHKLEGRGWNPASVVRAVTMMDGVSFAFYSLHICKSGARDGHAHNLATQVLPKEKTKRVIVVGDYNNKVGDAAMSTVEGAGFRPTWKDLQIDLSKEFTYNAQNPKKNLGVIDHILYKTSAGAKATDGGIIELEKPLSDHKPIWAEIAFPRDLEKVKPPE